MSKPPFSLLDHSKPILVFGRDGQIGRALQLCLKDLGIPVVFLGRADCDLSNELVVKEVLNCYQPQVIINAAAHTEVDKAESERELAFAINAKAPALMADYIAHIAHGILVQYSTDYVFADSKQVAYSESDTVGSVEKLSIYGQSKLAGEQAIQESFSLMHNSTHTEQPDKFSRYFIFRTSWVYGDGENFIRTMLRLADERNYLNVVADQVGTPTSAEWLAKVGIQIASSRLKSGIYHAVPDGETSWHGLAVFVIETAASCGRGLEFKPENIQSISAVDYPLPAPRPYNSRLSNLKLKKALSVIASKVEYPHWREQVTTYVKSIVNQ